MRPDELERFEAMVLPHLDAAYTLARYLMRNVQDAEDVVQDACVRALKYFGGFRGDAGASTRAWLLAIVRNTAFTALGRSGRAGRDETTFDETQHSDSAAEDNPETAMLRGAERESLVRALNDLAPEFREVIVLRELQGFSYKEISEVAGVPIGTVMSRLSRARARLQDALRNEQEP